MLIDEYRRGVPTYKGKNGQTVGMLCETKEQCITDDDGVALTDKLAGLKKYTDDAYANSNLYTDAKIGELINGAPTTLDTLKEIADAMAENADVVEALDEAVGSKVNQNEYDGHADNTTIHITADERTRWNNNSGGGSETTSRATLSTAGWYRVAEYKCDNATLPKGYFANGCELIIKRGSNVGYNEEHHLRFMSNYTNDCEITTLMSKSVSHIITKCRHTVDGNTAYLEVYNDRNSGYAFFAITNGSDYEFAWQAITPTLTSETVDGVTVTTTYDIPANASPVTDLDLNKLVDGTTSVGNALQLGGKGASEYALAEDFFSGDTYVFMQTDKDHAINNTIYRLMLVSGVVYLYNSTDNGATWNNLGTLATTADLANYLPNSGGAVGKGNTTIPFGVKGADGSSFVNYLNHDDTFLGFLGMNGANKPSYMTADRSTAYDLLHTGNSAKCVVVDTDPGVGASVSYADGTLIFVKE